MTTPFAQTLRSLDADRGLAARAVWAVAALTLGGWMAWFALAGVTLYEVSDRARLEVAEAPHRLNVAAAGRVTATALGLGRKVEAGEALVRLDDREARARLLEERERGAGLAARAASLRRELAARAEARAQEQASAVAASQLAQARRAETRAQTEFAEGARARLDRLAASGAGSQVEAIKAQTELTRLRAVGDGEAAEARRLQSDAAARAARAEAEIEALRNALAALEAEAAASSAAVGRLEGEIERLVVRAPAAGRLAEVEPLHVGAYLAEGARLATLLPDERLIVVADFRPSAAFGRIAPGQRARVRLDGFPWGQYGFLEATVTRVAGELRDGFARAELSVDSAPPIGLSLQHGLPGVAEIAVERASPAALVLRVAGLLIAPEARP